MKTADMMLFGVFLIAYENGDIRADKFYEWTPANIEIIRKTARELIPNKIEKKAELPGLLVTHF